jgi:hypothetical protein
MVGAENVTAHGVSRGGCATAIALASAALLGRADPSAMRHIESVQGFEANSAAVQQYLRVDMASIWMLLQGVTAGDVEREAPAVAAKVAAMVSARSVPHGALGVVMLSDDPAVRHRAVLIYEHLRVKSGDGPVRTYAECLLEKQNRRRSMRGLEPAAELSARSAGASYVNARAASGVSLRLLQPACLVPVRFVWLLWLCLLVGLGFGLGLSFVRALTVRCLGAVRCACMSGVL